MHRKTFFGIVIVTSILGLALIGAVPSQKAVKASSDVHRLAELPPNLTGQLHQMLQCTCEDCTRPHGRFGDEDTFQFPCACPSCCERCNAYGVSSATPPADERPMQPENGDSAMLTPSRVQTPPESAPYFDRLARKGGVPVWFSHPTACCMQTRANAMPSAMHYVHRN